MDVVIGRTLSRLRRRIGMPQREAARILGRSQSFVSFVESGKRGLNAADVPQYAAMLQVTTDEFYRQVRDSLAAAGWLAPHDRPLLPLCRTVRGGRAGRSNPTVKD